MVMEEYFGKPWANRASYTQHSPLTHVQNVQTPLLLQHGENDPRVPLVSGRRFYEALKALGKVVEFDIFPRGGHVQYQPAAQRASMQSNMEWFSAMDQAELTRTLRGGIIISGLRGLRGFLFS